MEHPTGQVFKAAAHQVVQDLKFHQHGQSRNTQVEQANEEQGPRDRRARLGHRGQGVKPGQQMRQAGGAHHETKNQSQKVDARLLKEFDLGRGAFRVARKGLRVHRHATQGPGALQVFLHGARPLLPRGQCIGGHRQQLTPGLRNRGVIGRLGFEHADFFFQLLTQLDQRTLHMLQTHFVHLGTSRKLFTHFDFARVMNQFFFNGLNARHLLAVCQGRQGCAQLLVGQPRHGDHEGHQQHDVLRHLGPSDGTHTTQKGTQQNPTQTQQDANFKLDAR